MTTRNRAGRILVAAGSVVLFTAAALHFLGGYRAGFPALAASDLDVGLQAGFRIVFLSAGWHWVLLGLIAMVASFKAAAAARRTIILICGLGLLIEAVVGAATMGAFIGNEVIGVAGILMIVGGLLL